MNKSKNILTVTLMISSIILLLVLQLFWIRSSYDRAFFGLRRDSNFIFRNTLYAMRDSLQKGNIRVVDTLDKFSRTIQSVHAPKSSDSIKLTARSSTVQVFITDQSGNNDSILDAIRPMTRHLRQRIEEGQKTFMIQLTPDTVNLDSLEFNFNAALHKANIPIAFRVKHLITPPEQFNAFRVRNDFNDLENIQNSIYNDTINLDGVRFNPMSRYSASIFPIRNFIIQQIAPQIFFSFFLTLITSITFIILYRNVRTQQRLMELKNDFISNVTHELKTPMATVSVALEALKNFNALDNPKLTREYLDIAQNELKRLTLMTDKILKASAFENTKVTLQKEIVDIREIISQILDSMRLIIEKRQAHVSFSAEGGNFRVEGERTHLTNVIYNLLDNALKYSLNQPVIQIVLKETSEELVFSIQDYGIGIAVEYRNKIFEKFFRVPTGNVHDIKGYGLGLSYVASVIKAHKGIIEVESESGKGSTFTIHWPKHCV